MIFGLLKLKDWLRDNGVQAVAMESIGVFWKPIFNILEDEFPVVLSNPSTSRKYQETRAMLKKAKGQRKCCVSV